MGRIGRTRCSELPGPSLQVGFWVIDDEGVVVDDGAAVREAGRGGARVVDNVDIAAACGLGAWEVVGVFLLLLMLVEPRVLWRMSFSRAWM